MIKYIYCVRKPQSMTGEQFRDYWLNKHGVMFQQHADAMRVKRYVQAHTLEHPVNEQLRASRGGLEAFDGVGEVWWDSLDDMIAGNTSPEGREGSEILRRDNVNFIDAARSAVFVADVHTIIDR